MSRDRDPDQRRWLSLGHGGKRALQPTWRYWQVGPKQWVISAPHELAKFEQRDKDVLYQGKVIVTADTQWSATWRTLAYFYEVLIPTLPAPPMSEGSDDAASTERIQPELRRVAVKSLLHAGRSAVVSSPPVESGATVSYPERVWIGSEYRHTRILVLGESWYGDFLGDLVTDDGYIRAYLAGEVTDPMYTKLANACAPDRRTFWEGIMFTNFVQRVGPTRDHRPTTKHYLEARSRLQQLIDMHEPRGVWILGIEQAKYSAPVVIEAGIPVEVTVHPTGYGVKSETLRSSWKALVAKASEWSTKT